MTFGRLVKNKRIRLNLTQKEISLKMQISQSTFSRIENDKQAPSIYHLKLLRDCLNISFDSYLDSLSKENHMV